MSDDSEELNASIGKLWEALVTNNILDEDEIVTGVEIIDITTNHINTLGWFGDFP